MAESNVDINLVRASRGELQALRDVRQEVFDSLIDGTEGMRSDSYYAQAMKSMGRRLSDEGAQLEIIDSQIEDLVLKNTK